MAGKALALYSVINVKHAPPACPCQLQPRSPRDAFIVLEAGGAAPCTAHSALSLCSLLTETLIYNLLTDATRNRN